MILKRIATSIVLFAIFFVIAYFAICIVGGIVVGAVAGAGIRDVQESYEAGRQAGESFVRSNLRAIVVGSLLISLVSSLALSFSGVLPWCRKPKQPARIEA